MHSSQGFNFSGRGRQEQQTSARGDDDGNAAAAAAEQPPPASFAAAEAFVDSSSGPSDRRIRGDGPAVLHPYESRMAFSSAMPLELSEDVHMSAGGYLPVDSHQHPHPEMRGSVESITDNEIMWRNVSQEPAMRGSLALDRVPSTEGGWDVEWPHSSGMPFQPQAHGSKQLYAGLPGSGLTGKGLGLWGSSARGVQDASVLLDLGEEEAPDMAAGPDHEASQLIVIKPSGPAPHQPSYIEPFSSFYTVMAPLDAYIVLQTHAAAAGLEVAHEQDHVWGLRCRAVGACTSAVVVVNVFTPVEAPQVEHQTVLEFQKRSGDWVAFTRCLEAFLALPGVVEGLALCPAASAAAAVPSDARATDEEEAQQEQEEEEADSLLLLSPRGGDSRPGSSRGPLSRTSSSSALGSMSSVLRPNLATDDGEARPTAVQSVPSELVAMLRARTLESQREASVALARLSSAWCSETAITHEVLDLLGTCVGSPDFDVSRCATICLANTAHIPEKRDDLTTNFKAMAALVESISTSSSVAILREGLRALDDLCQSHAAEVWGAIPRCKHSVTRHTSSPDSQVRGLAESLQDSVLAWLPSESNSPH